MTYVIMSALYKSDMSSGFNRARKKSRYRLEKLIAIKGDSAYDTKALVGDSL